MNRALPGVLILAAVLATGCGGSNSGAAAGRADDESFVRVSPRDPRYFELSNSTPFIPIGLNIAFPRFLVGEASVNKQMEERLRRLSENGGNLIRVWLSHPYYDVEHSRSGMYDSRKLERINALLNLARQYHIRVKFTLEHFTSLEDEAPRFPGAPSTGKSIHNIARGGLAKNMTEFFTLDSSRRRFKRKLAWFAKYYRNEPAIFGWELWSEINSVGGDGWQEWTAEMLAEAHRQFPNQLVMQGLGSLEVYRQRKLFASIWRLDDNEVVQVRRYLDPGAALEICHGPLDIALSDAVETARRAAPGKPVLLDEGGAVEAGHAGPSKLYLQDRLGTILHDVIFAPFFSGAAGCGLSWHWNFYVEKNDLWRHFGRFADVVKGLDPPAEHFQPGRIDHPRLRIYTLRGRHTFLAWCRDSQADWQRDIVGHAVVPVRDAVVDLNQLEGGVPAGHIRVYNPWTGKWHDARAENGKLRLPMFLRSIVIRIDG